VATYLNEKKKEKWGEEPPPNPEFRNPEFRNPAMEWEESEVGVEVVLEETGLKGRAPEFRMIATDVCQAQ